MAKEVKVYSTEMCPWCVKAKEFLKGHKVKFKAVDIAEDEKAREEMIEKSGQMGVPVIIIKDGEKEEVIVGFDEGRLKKVLGLK